MHTTHNVTRQSAGAPMAALSRAAFSSAARFTGLLARWAYRMVVRNWLRLTIWIGKPDDTALGAEVCPDLLITAPEGPGPWTEHYATGESDSRAG